MELQASRAREESSRWISQASAHSMRETMGLYCMLQNDYARLQEEVDMLRDHLREAGRWKALHHPVDRAH